MVYHYLHAWRLDGTWERVHTVLRERLRVRLGRNPQPTAGSIDSQSVKTIGVGGERGYDSGKQVKGHKRHLLVDTEGLVLTVRVHRANSMDRDGIQLLLPPATIRTPFPRLRHIWLDSGYNGKGNGKDWIERTLGWTAQIVAHRRRPSQIWTVDDLPDDQIGWSQYLPPPGFRGRPRRWVVERTFACAASARPASTAPGSASCCTDLLASDGVFRQSLNAEFRGPHHQVW